MSTTREIDWRVPENVDFDKEATWMPQSPLHSASEHGGHRCTDLPAIALLAVALCGLGSAHAYAKQHGNVQRLVRGFDFQGRMCGVDVPEKLLFWCRDPQGRLELNYPACVAACPQDDSGRAPCFDSALNRTAFVPTYRTKHFITLCLPRNRAEAKALLLQSVGRTRLGMIVRAYTTIANSWPLLVAGSCLGVIVAYAYVNLLQTHAASLLRLSMLCLVMGPGLIGVNYLRKGLNGGSDGQAETGDSGLNMWIGAAMVGLACFMAAVSCCFRGLETAVGCIEAASDLFVHEATILFAPFVSFASKAALIVYMLRGLVLLASCAEVQRYNDYGILRTLDLSVGLQALIAVHLFTMCWLLELSTAITEYAIAWTAQRWYFTPIAADGKRRAPSGSLCRGYANALRYHLGSLALGSFAIMVARPIRLTLGTITHAAQDCSAGLGACIAQSCAVLIAINQEFIERWDRSAYIDIAVSSDNFCRAASRSTKVISNQVPAVAALRGAQGIFVASGVGVTCAIPALLLWVECKLADELHWEDTFNPQYKKWILLGVVAICMSIGFTFMLVFDMVTDCVLYCFALDQRRHKKLKNTKDRARKARQVSEAGTSSFQWFFTGSTRIDVIEEEEIEYAPRRLRELISSQDHLYH